MARLTDAEARREYARKYREAHKERIKAYNKAYHAANKGDVGAKPKGQPCAVFALYKGDEFLDIGTKYELAEKYGLSPDSVYWYSTPSAKRIFYKHKGQGYTSVNLTKLEREGL